MWGCRAKQSAAQRPFKAIEHSECPFSGLQGGRSSTQLQKAVGESIFRELAALNGRLRFALMVTRSRGIRAVKEQWLATWLPEMARCGKAAEGVAQHTLSSRLMNWPKTVPAAKLIINSESPINPSTACISADENVLFGNLADWQLVSSNARRTQGGPEHAEPWYYGELQEC
jgi:hypothetical protein